MTLKPPPHYANVPAAIVFDKDLPDPIFRSLVQLHGLAWTTKGERTPPATVLQLATLRGLKERRMYDHLRELKERHLIRVENLGDGRIVVYPLRWADDTGAALSAASILTPADLATLEDHNVSTAKHCSNTAIDGNNVVVVSDPVVENQQQHNHIAPTAKNCSSETFTRLVDFGVAEREAQALAATCTLEQVDAWIAYARTAHNLRDATAFVISRLRSGSSPPIPKPDRQRYISGKYSQFIEH